LVAVVQALRDPARGCPWDLKQSFATLKPLVLDEAYEVADAVDLGDTELAEELGDLVGLIALFAQIGSEQGRFSLASIVQGVADKLIRRHPHVFGSTTVSGTEEVLRNWEQIKAQERKSARQEAAGLLGKIPRSMPALQRSQLYGERCATVGFDWESPSQVGQKVHEELRELLAEIPTTPAGSQAAPEAPPTPRSIAEFGDLLFALVQYGRHLGINAEAALTTANDTFNQRFTLLEQLARTRFGDHPLRELTHAQREGLWDEAKRMLAKGSHQA
jgi:MazG family protein